MSNDPLTHSVTFHPTADRFYFNSQCGLIFLKIMFEKFVPTFVTEAQLNKLREDVEFSRLEGTAGMVVSAIDAVPAPDIAVNPAPPATGNVEEMKDLEPPSGNQISDADAIAKILSQTVKQIEPIVKATTDVDTLRAFLAAEQAGEKRTGVLKAVNERIEDLA